MGPHAVKLAGTGMALPAAVLDSDEIDARQGRPRGWLARRCGVRRRHVCADETQEGMAAIAAREALAQAGLGPGDVDLVISASGVARQPIPATAPLIARELGIANGRCVAFDVNSTCLGFLTGLDVAGAMLATGRHRSVLVVSSEIASRALPWESEPETAGLFGDGAGAAVLTASEGTSLIKARHFESHPDGWELCQIEAGGTAIDPRREPERFAAGSLFHMDGRRLFKLTSERFPVFLERLLVAAGWTCGEVDLVVPHQASKLALDHLRQRCGFAADIVVDIVEGFGNQVAASLPTALHLALAAGRIGRGAKVLMLGTSAGVTFGGLALEF